MKLRYAVLLAFVLTLVVVPGALAQTVVPGPGDVAPQPEGAVATGVNLWLIVLGVGIRGIMYAINKGLPFIKTEAQKQVAAALAGAIGGALYTALFSGDLGLNDETLNAVLQATVATLGAHNLLFKPGGLNVKLGAEPGA